MHRPLAVALACTMSASTPASTPAGPVLRCALEAPASAVAGGPVLLRFTITNAGTAPLQLLRWNTPLEGGWFAPFVTVTREGRPLRYQGPAFKRGDPDAQSYLRLEAGASTTSELDLALPFDLSAPGRYHVEPHIRLVDAFDARTGQAPRPRKLHEGRDLPCPTVDFSLTARQ
jgi:hypothetical protein